MTCPPQTCPSERSDNGQNEGRQKCQEKVISRYKYSISSGKSKLPLRGGGGQECWAGSTRDRCHRPHLLSVATGLRWNQPRSGKKAQEARAGKRPAEANGCRSGPGQADPERSGRGKLLSPSRRRECVERVQRVLPAVSERRACMVLNQPRATQRRVLKSLDDEESLTNDIIKLAVRFGGYRYRRITALFRELGGWSTTSV